MRKKTEFSKKWLIACIVISAGFTATSYILAAFDKNPVETLSATVIETLWGASGISFVGYALQNSVRAYTSSRFGIPVEDKGEEAGREMPPELDEVLKKFMMKGRNKMKIDWKKKLTSRKFWGAVVGFVAPLLLAFGATDNDVAQIVSIITSGGVLIAYIIGEGLVDATAAKNQDESEDESCTQTRDLSGIAKTR